MKVSSCSVDGCENKPIARTWCRKHYLRWRKHGHPLGGKITYEDDASRFWAKVSKEGSFPTHDPGLGRCWKWLASTNSEGYGQFKYAGSMRSSHRVSYLLTHGSEPDGLGLDHICRNKECVNPSHLRLVTTKQNLEHVHLSSNNSSGYRGVSFQRKAKKWQAYVGHNGVRHSGGLFEDVHEAGEAARALRNKLFTHNDLDRRIS